MDLQLTFGAHRTPAPIAICEISGHPSPSHTILLVSFLVNIMATLSARFIRALRGLENDRDLQPLVQLFAEHCEITSPLFANSMQDMEGARRYWRKYLDNFEEVRTEFISVVDGNDISALEWISSATLSGGRPVEFSGATVLLSEENRITSLHAYFDSRSLRDEAQRGDPRFRAA